jgi:hypothetical protein
MHEVARIVHRDVKPSNILYDEHGAVFLADLGIARAIHRNADDLLTRSDAMPGSARYMAPEAMKGEYGPAYDQYALGVMVFQALSGENPHKGETTWEIMHNKRNHAPEPIRAHCEWLPPDAAEAVERALEREPFARHPSCAAFVNAFARPFRSRERGDTSGGFEAVPARRSTPAPAVIPAYRPPEARAAAPARAPGTPPLERDAVPARPPPPPPRAPGPPPPAPPVAPAPPQPPMAAAAAGLLSRVFGGLAKPPTPEPPRPAPPPEGPTPVVEEDVVDCTVYAPARARPGGTVLVQAFVHPPHLADRASASAAEADEGAKRRGEIALARPLPRGGTVTIRLETDGARVDPAVQEFRYAGRSTGAAFHVHLPASVEDLHGKVSVLFGDDRAIGHVPFRVAVDAGEARGSRR